MAIGKFFILKLFILTLLFSGLYAQDNSDVPLWRQGLGGSVIGRPIAQVESVVAVTDGGNLRSYTSEGIFLWDYFARGWLTPYISRSREGTTYIGRTNGNLIAVNRSGRELWHLNLRAPIVSPVLIGWDGRLFVFTDRRIICMTASGYTLWSRTFAHRTVLGPVRDSAGGVILLLENGALLRLDPFGNVFSYTVSPKIPSAFTSLEPSGYGLPVLLLYDDQSVELIYMPQGVGGYFGRSIVLPSAPLAAFGRHDEVAILLKDGSVALVSMEKEIIIWTEASHIRPGDLPENPRQEDLHLFYDERGIYVLTKNGATGFTSDGRRLWTMRLMGAASVPSFGDDGVLYSGGLDWILYAYRLEDRIRPTRQLIYGDMPEGNYGTGNPGPSSWADYHFRFEETELNSRFNVIQNAVRNGTVGANEKEYAAWLMETAGSQITSPPSQIQPNVFAHYRVEAAKLLAYIGSRETIPFLANLFTLDPDPVVKAAAAEAIGKIGVDPEGLALRAFQNALHSPSRIADESTLIAIAEATGALCRFSGPPLSASGIRLLSTLSVYDRFPVVRNRAQRELLSLHWGTQ